MWRWQQCFIVLGCNGKQSGHPLWMIYETALQPWIKITRVFAYTVNSSLRTYTCWKRRMLSKMLNCCQRLEKLTFPSIRSGFPRWTNVKSWRMRPLQDRGVVAIKKMKTSLLCQKKIMDAEWGCNCIISFTVLWWQKCHGDMMRQMVDLCAKSHFFFRQYSRVRRSRYYSCHRKRQMPQMENQVRKYVKL